MEGGSTGETKRGNQRGLGRQTYGWVKPKGEDSQEGKAKGSEFVLGVRKSEKDQKKGEERKIAITGKKLQTGNSEREKHQQPDRGCKEPTGRVCRKRRRVSRLAGSTSSRLAPQVQRFCPSKGWEGKTSHRS